MIPASVVLCGTNYGRAYVPAIESLGDDAELVGILARGSERSRRLADRLDLPLWHRPEDLPREIDLACVAVPSSETDLIPDLLRRDIHVLTDHPVAPETLERALPLASDRGLVLHVNGHFACLDAVRAFVESAARFRGEGPVLHVDVFTTDRLLHGALDVVGRALGTLGPCEMTAAATDATVRTATGKIGGTRATLQVQHAGPRSGEALEDGSEHYFADLRVSLAFGAGTLSLLSLAGPVVWTWNLARGARRSVPGPVTIHEGTGMAQLGDQRRRANADALRSALGCVGAVDDVPVDQSPSYLLELSSSWARISGVLFP